MTTDVSEKVISAVGLTKVFRDFWARPKAKAVNDVDFEVRQGEVFGLLGPNGSGKSTTVKMILGLLYPTAGNLKVLGKSPKDVEIKQRIGYLPEETYLYKYLTAEETLKFFGSLFGYKGDELKRRVDQLLDMVGLSHVRSRYVGEFSKGMQRRIGLAQAMINDPSLLILDEPTSGLDPIGCKEVKDLIKLLKSRGKTVLVTSHLLSDVEDVCDRVLILYGGKVRSEGQIKDLLKIQEQSQINIPELDSQQTEKILALLKEKLPEKAITLSNPQMNLEQFFLSVVNEAMQQEVETSGATSTGEIAEYLQDDLEDAEKNELLATLIEESPDVDKTAKEEILPETEKNEKDLSEEIKSLAEKELDKIDEEENKKEEAVVQDEFSEADSKLNDLLSKDLDD